MQAQDPENSKFLEIILIIPQVHQNHVEHINNSELNVHDIKDST